MKRRTKRQQQPHRRLPHNDQEKDKEKETIVEETNEIQTAKIVMLYHYIQLDSYPLKLLIESREK